MQGTDQVSANCSFPTIPCFENAGICRICSALIEKIKAIFKSIHDYFVPPISKSVVRAETFKTDIKIQKLLINPPQSPEIAKVVEQSKQILTEARQFRGTPEEHHNKFQNAHTEISQLLFVAQSEEYTLKLAQAAPIKRAEVPIAFKNALQEIQEKLNDVEADHKNSGLQDPRIALSIAKSREIGKALVSPNGSLNTGIIKDLKRLIPPNTELDSDKDILRVLDALENSSELHTIFDSIVKPVTIGHPINIVIKCVLGLPFDTVISDNHAKQAALVALLSHLRQGPIGSCFATYLGIGLMNQKLEKCLRDFKEILETGKAVRLVNGVPKEFNFVLNIADESRTRKFKIDRAGKALDAPGIQSAINQMGLVNYEMKKREALAAIFKDSNEDSKEIDAQTLLGFFANSFQLEMGLFAFCCETNNGLLRVWENLLAAMGEADLSGYNNGRIVKCVLDSFDELLKSSALIKTKQIADDVKETLKGKIEDRIKLVYDSSIGDGGYRLPDISSPTDFKNMVITALKSTEAAFPPNPGETTNGYLTTVKKITEFVENDPLFMKKVLWNFDDENKKLENPEADWKKCKSLPWQFETGNSLRKTYATELEQPIPTPTLAHPKNALDLAVIFLKFCKSLEKTTDIYRNTKPEEMIPVETPTHVFNAKVESEKVNQFRASNKSPQDWLKENLVEPSKRALVGQIDPANRAKVYKFILDNQLIPQDKVSEFKSKCNALPKVMQMQSFSSAMMEILIKLNKPDAKQKNELWQHLSAYLMTEGLPEKACKQLNSASLTIADLNWNKAVEDLDFKVIFDVITMTPVLVGVNNSRTYFKVVDQEEWVKVRWRFFPTNY